MTQAELEEELAATRAAILRVLNQAQSWTQGGRAAAQAQLKELREHRRELERRLTAMTGQRRLHQAVPRG
jgi:hypothetical protein